MADGNQIFIRDELLDVLMEKVLAATYPSVEMLDEIEALLGPDELSAYAAHLVERVRADNYPSWPLIRRLHRLAERQTYAAMAMRA